MNKGALLFSLLHFIFVCIVANEEGFSTPFTIPVIVILVISSATARRLPHGCPNLSLFGFLCSLLIFIFTLIWAVAILLVPPSVLATCLITAVSIVLCVLVVKGVFSKFKSHEREDWLIKNKTKTGIIGLLIVTILVLAYFFGNLFKTDYESLPLQKLVHLAEQGDVNAQYNLGESYDDGQGVPEDDVEAVKWWRKAAEQGHAKAQFSLGIAYALGQGVPRDYVLSYMWSNLAVAQGHKNANAVKWRLSKEMTREQIAVAQKLSREWSEKILWRKEHSPRPGQYFSEYELEAARKRLKDSYKKGRKVVDPFQQPAR